MKKIAVLASLALAAASAVTNAGDVAAGKEKAAICFTCHGPAGKEPIMPLYPKLAGQNEQYLVNALKAYKANQRQGGMSAVMTAQAAMLSDEDIANLAAYFAAQ